MKMSSKSILSPGHHSREGASFLSGSLSRRLRTNRSLRGAQSPMFPSGKTRAARPFDNPEPSSPKVTCIGQVRVKTRKKQGNRNIHKTLSRNREGSCEVSFRKVDKNQRWVHLPLTICETLRAFGAEFSCLFPCRTSSCLSDGERRKADESRERGSCGTVFARWLVAVDGGKREIELVVGGEEEDDKRDQGFSRHGVGEIELQLKEEQGKVSICVPPKNALLLMRCRSDPLRVNALANRLFECPLPTGEDEEEERQDKNLGETKLKGIDSIFFGETDEFVKPDLTEPGSEEDKVYPEIDIDANVAMELKVGEEIEDLQAVKLDINGEIGEEVGEKVEEGESEEVEVEELPVELSESSSGAVENMEELEIGRTEELMIGNTEELVISKIGEFVVEDDQSIAEKFGEEEEEEEERRTSRYSCSSVISLHLEIAEREIETEVERDGPQIEETEEEIEEVVVEEEEIKIEDRGREAVLPDCLLLMRCEPKLSMEVSKETWVCSTDFVRWLPKRRPKANKINGGDESKRKSTVDSYAPPRSSCSFPAPAPASMGALIEQRLMNAAAYEPFVLTRCKSEPMRTAAAKLMPEGCSWKNTKLEPHRSANFSVGAAGIGF